MRSSGRGCGRAATVREDSRRFGPPGPFPPSGREVPQTVVSLASTAFKGRFASVVVSTSPGRLAPRGLTEAEVRPPPVEVAGQLLHHLRQTDPPCSTRQFPDTFLEPHHGHGLCRLLPTRPARLASHPVSVRQVAVLLRTSFRRRLTTPPLRFANPSPPSGWVEEFHLQTVKHARHTTKIAGNRWRLSAKRGAGGSRTHDGGFAIRCLSHLATAPRLHN